MKNSKTKLLEKGMMNTSVDKELRLEQFRVALFGSARIKPNDKIFREVMELSKAVGEMELDVVSGGGPGIMEAANLGHQMGTNGKSQSIGFTIELPWENEGNHHLDLKKHFRTFSSRLDNFMAISNVVIVMPGGVGTCLEFFYAWQLTQVHHIQNVPIILHGEMWAELVKWIKKYPLKAGLISPKDMDNIICVKTNKEALDIIKKRLMEYKKQKKSDREASREYKMLLGLA